MAFEEFDLIPEAEYEETSFTRAFSARLIYEQMRETERGYALMGLYYETPSQLLIDRMITSLAASMEQSIEDIESRGMMPGDSERLQHEYYGAFFIQGAEMALSGMLVDEIDLDLSESMVELTKKLFAGKEEEYVRMGERLLERIAELAIAEEISESRVVLDENYYATVMRDVYESPWNFIDLRLQQLHDASADGNFEELSLLLGRNVARVLNLVGEFEETIQTQEYRDSIEAWKLNLHNATIQIIREQVTRFWGDEILYYLPDQYKPLFGDGGASSD